MFDGSIEGLLRNGMRVRAKGAGEEGQTGTVLDAGRWAVAQVHLSDTGLSKWFNKKE